MAKILFIVNEHPCEAYAITVARETAKLLRGQGHTVIWKKIKPTDSALGAILKSKKKQFSEKELDYIHFYKAGRRTLSTIEKVKPDLTYNFHCTPHDWYKWTRGVKADFSIEPIKDEGNRSLMTVEIKAVYKPFPRGVFEIISRKVSYRSFDVSHYLRETTSHQLTRAKGLHTENFAETIAAALEKQIRSKRFDSVIKGKISRRRPKQRNIKPRLGPKVRPRRI